MTLFDISVKRKEELSTLFQSFSQKDLEYMEALFDLRKAEALAKADAITMQDQMDFADQHGANLYGDEEYY